MNIKRVFKTVFIIVVTITVLLIVSYSLQSRGDKVLLSASSRNNFETVNKIKSADTLTSTKCKDYFYCGPEVLIENSNLPVRILSDNEKAGNNIMITIRTTKKFHQKRLSILYDTWLTVVNGSNVFLVTDGEDDEYQEKSKKLGINYVVMSCGLNYSRWSLCCKSGEEMALMHRPENKHYDWFCHMDDDFYVIVENLVKLLSKMDPKTEARYIGKPLTPWRSPYVYNNRKFHFAAGGMYCLSRAMLEKVKPWLGNGTTMTKTCDMTLQPEDVTVGIVVELLANERLTRTQLIYTHSNLLSQFKIDHKTLKQQVGFAYGCGQLCHLKILKNNAIRVPNAKFPYKDDLSRFKSLHCYLYPKASICN